MNDALVFLPLAAGTASLLLLPAAAGPLARPQAMTIALAGPALAVLLLLLWLPEVPTAWTTLAALAAMLAASGLIDRARRIGLSVASALAALGAVATAAYAWDMLGGSSLTMLYVVLLVAGMVGLAGSALLPLSPLRHDASGTLRALPIRTGQWLAGWGIAAVAVAMLADRLLGGLPAGTPIAVLSAMLLALVTAEEDGLAKAGEAAMAGLLIALPAHLSPQAAVLAGLLAAFFAARSEAITQAIRLDDPLRLTGAVLLPAAFGLLMPGALDAAQLAPALHTLGYTIAGAAFISLILWPLTMIVLGLALPPRLAREGVHRR